MRRDSFAVLGLPPAVRRTGKTRVRTSNQRYIGTFSYMAAEPKPLPIGPILRARAMPWDGAYVVSYEFGDRRRRVLVIDSKQDAEEAASNLVGKNAQYLNNLVTRFSKTS